MSQLNCLNCSTPVLQRYCPVCGQKADTHRITFKHFVTHDLIHGVWHFERGIFFTLKEALKRPGQAALDYVKGKRVRYYNIFYLALLIIGLNILLVHLYDNAGPSMVEFSRKTVDASTAFFSKNVKFFTLGAIPLLSLNAFIVFRRLRLNLSEHFILAGFSLLGILIVSLSYYFLIFLLNISDGLLLFGYLKILVFAVMFLFPVWSYYNAFRTNYSILGFLWRILVFYILGICELGYIMSVFSYYLSGQTGVNINI